MTTKPTQEAPERLFVRLTPMGGTISYLLDPDKLDGDERPVYQYVRADLSPVVDADSQINICDPALAANDIVFNSTDMEHMRVRIEAELRRWQTAYSNAAASMRSRCVEKVKEKIADLSRTGIAAEQNAVELRTLHALHNELESVSIQEQEAKQG